MAFEIGYSKKMKSGERATIISINNEEDIDIQFEDGNILTHIPYKRFEGRNLSNPNKFKVNYNRVKKAFEQRGYILLSKEYQNARASLQYICPKHPNKIREISWFKFNEGHGCPECGKEKVAKVLHDVHQTPYSIVQEKFAQAELNLLTSKEEYENSRKIKLKFVCSCSPNEIQEKTWDAFLSSPHCSKCYHKEEKEEYRKQGYENFVKLCSELEYIVVSKENDYINSNSIMWYKCPKHGKHHTTLSHLKEGKICPDCAVGKSKGEIRICSYLDELNCEYVRQQRFTDLRGKDNRSYLPYDFYLPKYNLLIEYQGEFHDGTVHKTNPNFQTLEDFYLQQERDLRKKNYALDNGYNFLEIWYWDYENIENILKKELSKCL